MIIVFLITSIECIGDTTATCEASRLPTDGPELMVYIKGALFNDGITSVFSSLAFSMPLTTFAQNNGVIALTNVGSKQAGWACGFWLIVLGIFAKFGGWVLSIPNCILGGMTTFLFANVISSGIKILMLAGPLRRRERFILTCGLALGIGVTLVPEWASNDLWPPYSNPDSVGAVFRASVLAILESGFCLSAIVTVILNLILPTDEEMPPMDDLPLAIKSDPSAAFGKPGYEVQGSITVPFSPVPPVSRQSASQETVSQAPNGRLSIVVKRTSLSNV
jgi:uric acid-xanthine permease